MTPLEIPAGAAVAVNGEDLTVTRCDADGIGGTWARGGLLSYRWCEVRTVHYH